MLRRGKMGRWRNNGNRTGERKTLHFSMLTIHHIKIIHVTAYAECVSLRYLLPRRALRLYSFLND